MPGGVQLPSSAACCGTSVEVRHRLANLLVLHQRIAVAVSLRRQNRGPQRADEGDPRRRLPLLAGRREWGHLGRGRRGGGRLGARRCGRGADRRRAVPGIGGSSRCRPGAAEHGRTQPRRDHAGLGPASPYHSPVSRHVDLRPLRTRATNVTTRQLRRSRSAALLTCAVVVIRRAGRPPCPWPSRSARRCRRSCRWCRAVSRRRRRRATSSRRRRRAPRPRTVGAGWGTSRNVPW
jgi:hypothetical protein